MIFKKGLSTIFPYFILTQVEALKNYRVVDVACGSGDAQTLCITDDDSVWSWGDGDYGKLGVDTLLHCFLVNCSTVLIL